MPEAQTDSDTTQWLPRASCQARDVIDRMQRFLRATAANRREVVGSPPFTVYIEPGEALKFHNYAVPDGDVVPAREEIERMRELFRERERLPRLEWIEEFAPRVAPELARAGMLQELRTPLMGCEPADLIAASADVDSLSIEPIRDGDLRPASDVRQSGFGNDPLAPDEAPRDPRAKGGGGVLARSGAEPVAVGGWTAVIDGVSELVGIATLERWRRRGLGGAVTAALAREAFAAGAGLCVLTPADEDAMRVYERAGFRRIATVLHWSDEGAA
jgi:ribosomal protein S18 acetylase RimI-like enzyme